VAHGRPGRAPWGTFGRLVDLDCIWPNCEAQTGVASVPLCNRHALKVYHEVRAAGVDAGAITYDGELLISPDAAERGGRTRGLVYCIRFGDRVKIGWTADLKQRLKALPYDEVIAVTPGAVADEQAVHRRFALLRLTGEWFKDDPEIREFVGRWAS
jgi:hypothetical protein